MINTITRPIFWACAVLLVLTTLSGRGIAEERWVEGQHYQILTPTVATGSNGGGEYLVMLPLHPALFCYPSATQRGQNKQYSASPKNGSSDGVDHRDLSMEWVTSVTRRYYELAMK